MKTVFLINFTDVQWQKYFEMIQEIRRKYYPASYNSQSTAKDTKDTWFTYYEAYKTKLFEQHAIFSNDVPKGWVGFKLDNRSASFNFDAAYDSVPVENVLEYDGEYLPGHKLQRYSSTNYDNFNQILDIKFKFIWEEDVMEKTDTFTTPLRYYFRYELENLIGRTNFKLERIYGDFKRSELNNKSNEFIVICRK